MAEWRVSEIYEPEAPETPQPKKAARSSVKEWAEEDRPRERLIRNGAQTLSSAELLAILIGSGNTDESAVDLMKRLLGDCGNQLSRLSKLSLPELKAYKGIGTAKALTIMAACELGRRREGETPEKRKCLINSQQIYDHLWPKMRDLDIEVSYVLLMNQGSRLIDTVYLSHGGITETAVDVRLIIKHALMANATIIALAHNHPSGNARPSREDDNLTKALSEACSTMRLHLADHLIITDGDYYSYYDDNKL